MDCDRARNLLAAEAAGDLPATEWPELSAHLGGCASCTGIQGAMREAAGLLRADLLVPARPGGLERLLAAVRTGPVPETVTPSAGWLALPMAAAAAVVLAFVLRAPAPHRTPTQDVFGKGADVRAVGSGFETVDSATGRRVRWTPAFGGAGAGVPVEGRLEHGVLDVEFPATLPTGSEGQPFVVRARGGEVRLLAAAGARYVVEQESGAAAVTGTLRPVAPDSRTLTGDSGETSLPALIGGTLAPAMGRTFRNDAIGAEGVRTRLVGTGLSADTALVLAKRQALAAGLELVADGRALVLRGRATASGAPIAPQARMREGDLYVSVEGAGHAELFLAGDGERRTASGGQQLVLLGRDLGRYGVPARSDQDGLASRVLVRGLSGAGEGRVAVIEVDGTERTLAAGDVLLGYEVRRVGAGGLALTRGGALYRLRMAAGRE